MSETTLAHRIMLALTNLGSRMFRNQVGLAYVGDVTRVKKYGAYNLAPGDIILRKARTVTTGLCVGSSDLIGWTPKTCTPEMLGTRVAIFTACEVKVEGGRVRPEQRHFGEQVQKAGGIFSIAHNELEAGDAVMLYRGSGIRGLTLNANRL